MASIDKMMEANARGRRKAETPSVTAEDLGGGKFMPQAGKLIPVARIRSSPYQPRLTMDPEALALLADSISSGGQDTPILVRPVVIEGESFYELIDGHRRVEAVSSLKWEEIAANIREVTDAEAAIMALSANVSSAGYSPYEIGKAMKRLLDDGHVTTKVKLEKLFGVARSQVYRCLSLAELPEKLTVILDSHPWLVGTACGEVLGKMVAEGDSELAHKGLLRILDGEIKESHLETWWRHTKADTQAQAPVQAEAVRQDQHILAKIKPNKQGGFDMSVRPLSPIDSEKLKAALMKALTDLKVVPVEP